MNQTQLFDQMPESDLAILKKAMNILQCYFEETPKCVNPNVQLHTTTRKFLEDVRKEFKNQWIERKHPVLEKIMRDHYVKDLYTMLRQYDKHNLVEIQRHDNKSQNIAKFRFV
jgi:hypothetical protein